MILMPSNNFALSGDHSQNVNGTWVGVVGCKQTGKFVLIFLNLGLKARTHSAVLPLADSDCRGFRILNMFDRVSRLTFTESLSLVLPLILTPNHRVGMGLKDRLRG